MQRVIYRGLTWASWAVALPWLGWKRLRGGSEWRERFGELPDCKGGLWVHAASVGEVAAASPLVRALSELGERLLLTALTPTGRRSAGRLKGPEVSVAHPPLDLPPFVGRALESVSPRALLVVETELWPNLLSEAAYRGVRVAVVNGRLSERSVARYGSPLFPLRAIRDSLSLVACRSEADRERFEELGFARDVLEVTGSTKFDAAPEPPADEERAAMREELLVDAGDRVVVFGSVRPAEEAAVLDAVAGLVESGARAIVAPRHLDRTAHLSKGLRARGIGFRLRSQGPEGGGRPPVTVLDTTGELRLVYSLADVAFVGGTLEPYGGHNPLEPAAMGVPVVFGPHTSSCAYEAALLVERGAAFRVEDARGLGGTLASLLEDEAARTRAGARALEAVSSGRGATRRTIELLRGKGILTGGPVERG
ncbi:MAG: 3-deoxy-D-manno-octulosonic acid transferase [Candidatus Eisenbacteria bacterium]|nr:3-deoxy-D-manno-octulosonic acid transferase [Candidatus Eisenbacteria bacterium]